MKSKEISFTTIEGVRDYRDERIRAHVPAHVSCIRSAFNQPEFDELDIRNHIAGDLIILGLSGKELVSYASTNFNHSPRQVFGEGYPDTNGSYFVAGVVAREFQHRVVYARLNSLRVQQAVERDQQAIFTRTQNPFVEAGIKRALKHSGITPHIDRYHSPGCYGHMLTASQPIHRDSALTRHYKQLDYGAGDAFVLVFDLSSSGENNGLPLYFSTSW